MAHQGGVDVDAVVDQLDHHPVVREQGQHRPGRAVVQRGHAVEQVGGHPGAGIDGGAGCVVGRVGVTDRGHRPRAHEVSDRVQPPGAFRGEGHHPNVAGAGVEQGIDVLRRGVAQQRRVVGAAVRHGQERSLQMDAGDAPGGGRPGQPPHGRDHVR